MPPFLNCLEEVFSETRIRLGASLFNATGAKPLFPLRALPSTVPERTRNAAAGIVRINGAIIRGAYWVYTAEGPERRYVQGKTRAEVNHKLTKAIANRDGGLIFDAGSLTVGDYLERWLMNCVRGTVRSSTFEGHKHTIRPYIVPTLGRVKLKNLNPTHVRGLYREKLDSGLSAATVRKMHSVLHKALKQAVLDGLVPRNICEAVKPPKVERKEIDPLDREQAKALLEEASGDRLEALYVLTVHTGMREGELLGLKWEDVDLECGVLRLRHGLVREGDKTALGDLKSPKSRRSIRLPVWPQKP